MPLPRREVPIEKTHLFVCDVCVFGHCTLITKGKNLPCLCGNTKKPEWKEKIDEF